MHRRRILAATLAISSVIAVGVGQPAMANNDTASMAACLGTTVHPSDTTLTTLRPNFQPPRVTRFGIVERDAFRLLTIPSYDWVTAQHS